MPPHRYNADCFYIRQNNGSMMWCFVFHVSLSTFSATSRQFLVTTKEVPCEIVFTAVGVCHFPLPCLGSSKDDLFALKRQDPSFTTTAY
jgi:hypothetical protein